MNKTKRGEQQQEEGKKRKITDRRHVRKSKREKSSAKEMTD